MLGFISRYLSLDSCFWIMHAGLPPSPPSSPLGVSSIDDGPKPGRDNNGMMVKPIGVDVSKKEKEGSHGSMTVIIVLSSVTAFVLFIGLAWLCVLKYSSCVYEHEQISDGLTPSSSKQSSKSTWSKLCW